MVQEVRYPRPYRVRYAYKHILLPWNEVQSGWTWFMMQVSSSFFGSVRVDCCARKFRVMVAADQFRTLQLTYLPNDTRALAR